MKFVIFFKQFLTVKYLFQINSVMVESGDKYIFVTGIVLVILGAVFKLASLYAPDPINKKYRQKFFSLFMFAGISEIVWYGARVEDIRFFGTHFVAWLLILISLVWLLLLLVKMIKNYRKEISVWEKEQVKLKYLTK